MTAVEAFEAPRRACAGRGRSSRRRGSSPTPAALEPASVRGWIFSNELYDALPVVRVEGSADGLRELRVGWNGGARSSGRAARAVRRSAPSTSRASAVDARARPEGARSPPTPRPLHRHLAPALAAGLGRDVRLRPPGAQSSTIPSRGPKGTLAVHEGGRRGGDPLERPGERDLTAHVNWDVLLRVGEEEGLSRRASGAPGTVSLGDRHSRLRGVERGEVARLPARRSGGNGRGDLGSDSAQGIAVGRPGGSSSSPLELANELPALPGPFVSSTRSDRMPRQWVSTFRSSCSPCSPRLCRSGTIIRRAGRSRRTKPNPAKLEPYECGVEATTVGFRHALLGPLLPDRRPLRRLRRGDDLPLSRGPSCSTGWGCSASSRCSSSW